mgnify:CR=1 FL=1
MKKILAKQLQEKDIQAEIYSYYLDCEQNLEKKQKINDTLKYAYNPFNLLIISTTLLLRISGQFSLNVNPKTTTFA